MRGKKFFLIFQKSWSLSRYGNFKVSKLGVFCLLCYVIKTVIFSITNYVFIMQWLPVSMRNLLVWKKLNTCSLNNWVIFKHKCLKFSKLIKSYVFYSNTLYSLVNICKLAILIMQITLHKLCSIKHDKSTVYFCDVKCRKSSWRCLKEN